MAQQNVTMQLLLEIRQFRAAWGQAQAAARSGGAAVARSAQTGGAAMGQATKKATGFAGAINFLKTRVIGAGLFFAAFYQGLITFRKLIGDAVGELFDLDDALRRVQSITKQSDASIANLKNQLLAAARSGELFDQSAADVADAMFNIAQAGFDAQESLQIAKIAAEGAAVGFTTAEVASRVLIGVLKAYDRPVADTREIMNTLFQTVDTGIVTFEDLSTGLGKVLSSSAALDVPLEEVTAAVATLTLRGFTAEQAMTGLGRIMQTFIRPSMRAKKAAKELGIELNAETIATEGLIGAMEIMFEKTGGNINKFATLFDRIQSTRAATSLFKDDGELLNAVLVEMGGAQDGVGAAALAMAEREKSVSFQLAIMRVQMLAVTTQALEPLLQGMGNFAKMMNGILAGENRIINFLFDLKAIIFGVAAAFIFMRGTAIIGLFAGLVTAIQNGIIWFSLYRAQAMLTTGVLMALRSVLMTLAPILIFAAVFGFKKLADHMSPIKGIAENMSDRMETLRDRFEAINNEIDKGIGSNRTQVRVLQTQMAVDELADAIENEFGPALHDARQLQGDWVNSTKAVVTWLGRATFGLGDFRKGASVVKDELRSFLDNEFAALIDDLQLTDDELRLLGASFRVMADESTSMWTGEAELLEIAAGKMDELAAKTHDERRIVEEILKLTGAEVDELGNLIPPTSEWEEALSDLLDPIEKARDFLKEILGMTTSQDIILRTKVLPLELKQAENNELINDLKLEQNQRALDMGISLDEIDESEDGILVKLGDQMTVLEDQNDAYDLQIDKLETSNEVESKKSELLLANFDLLLLQEGKYGDIILETDEQLRLLSTMIFILQNGGIPALEDWLANEVEQGRVLDEDVLGALIAIVDEMEGSEYSIDVTNAINSLANVQTRVDGINNSMFSIPQGFDPFEGALPAGQHGLRNFMGGLAMVGEAGPEIVRLPRGSDVIRNEDMGHALRGASTAIKRSETNLDHVSGEGGARSTIFIDELHLHGDARAALDSLSLAVTEPGV